MFPASSKGGGSCAAFPDVCKVPAPPAPFVPTPFPNMSQVATASSTSRKVKICGKEAVTVGSKISRSNGDEAGTLFGMMSQVNMNQTTYRQGSTAVKCEGKAIVTVLKPTAQNGMNANAPVGAQVAPSQTKVLILR
ncbi:MAG: PAAR-like domain-containing protein [Polyangiales bacterium]